MTDVPLNRLRAICLAFPEAMEKLTWDHPTFRVRDKIFAMQTVNDGRIAACCKAAPGGQDILVRGDAERFFAPPYVGPRGWVGVYIDQGVDWDQVIALVEESYRLTAPRRLSALLDQD